MVMAKQRVSEALLVKRLEKETNLHGSLLVKAREYGVSPQFLSDVIRGRRNVTENLARALGYTRIIEFEKSKA